MSHEALPQSHDADSFVRGLDNLVIDKTSVSWIDGPNSRLYYRGIDIVELATQSTFEETAYLLMCGQLPSARQLSSFSWKIRQMMHTQEKVIRVVQELPQHTPPLFALQAALAVFASIESSYGTAEDESLFETSMRIVAQTPVIVAAAYRHSLSMPVIPPRDDLSHTENFLYMLTGKIPSKHLARSMETALILQMDNGFTSSTFTARAVASTLTNLYAATSAATAALSGPLVGAACLQVYDMIRDLRRGIEPGEFVRQRMERGLRIAGLGHRVYEICDPRANILENVLESLTSNNERNSDLFLLRKVAAEAKSWCDERGQHIFPNVDFWSGAVYRKLDLRPPLFPAITAVARSAGWTAHMMELRADNCLYRPRSLYTGRINLPYVPLEHRQTEEVRS